MPGDHKDKKKKRIEDIRDRLAKISKKVPQDRIPRSPNEDNNFQTRIDKPIEQRALKEKVKKSKKYKTHAERDTEKHGEGLYEMMDRFGEIDKKKPKQKKAELTDVTKEHKQKQKKKDKLIHEARGTGVIPTYSKSKVKKTPPQGPNPNAETADDILKNAEVVSRKNDTYIGQLKQKIAEKRKKDLQRLEAEEEEEQARKHKHLIEFKGHTGQYYKRASLVSASGKYAKYWLLNAKQTNGNGWGVSQQSIAKNIHKFIGRPLVVTAKSWVPNSAYGDQFEHPYLPTNDINKVLDHQERYRVGSIVDIIEKDGDYFANIEINQKFANMILPPFCSPAIFQNNPAEPEGQISDWEALHLAALMEDPAYGSRIALLRGTCVGTKNECTVQFKSAKKEAKMVCTKGLKERLARVKKNEKTSDQAIDDVIKDIKDPDLREDAETRHHHTRPKRLYNYNKKAKLKQRLGKVRTAKPIIQETGEGITFKKVDPKIYGKKTYGWHKVPMHPSNAILIRPKDPEHYMDLVKHFRKIHETHDFAKYTQGTVQQSIPLRSLKNDIKHMSGESLKHHADISSAKNKAFKKGDILMRRVGGTPEKGKYGTVGETFYIEEDSPKGELFKSPTKDELHQRYNAKLKQRLSKISGMPKDNKWVYDSIDDPYMSTEIAEHRELEYPVIKWNKGEEYAVLSNKSGKPLQDNKFSTKNPPKNIEYLQQFNNPEDALDYSEYKHTKEYGPHLFENDEHFKGLEKKFKHIKDPNTQYQ